MFHGEWWGSPMVEFMGMVRGGSVLYFQRSEVMVLSFFLWGDGIYVHPMTARTQLLSQQLGALACDALVRIWKKVLLSSQWFPSVCHMFWHRAGEHQDLCHFLAPQCRPGSCTVTAFRCCWGKSWSRGGLSLSLAALLHMQWRAKMQKLKSYDYLM